MIDSRHGMSSRSMRRRVPMQHALSMGRGRSAASQARTTASARDKVDARHGAEIAAPIICGSVGRSTQKAIVRFQAVFEIAAVLVRHHYRHLLDARRESYVAIVRAALCASKRQYLDDRVVLRGETWRSDYRSLMSTPCTPKGRGQNLS